VLFTGFFLTVLWRSRRTRSPVAFWAHVVILVGLVQMPYYGMLPAGIHVLMAASALALRGDERSSEDQGVAAPVDRDRTLVGSAAVRTQRD
jgi:hypothetical protein